MINFNKHTIKLLKFIKKHGECSEEAIIKKFSDDGTTWELISLCKSQYLLCRKSDGTFTDFSDDVFNTSYDFKYWVTPKGDEILENKSFEFFKWVLPVIISILALIFSILSFVFSVMNDSPILVKLIK